MRALLSFLIFSLTAVCGFSQNLVYGGNVSIGGNNGGTSASSGANWAQDQAPVANGGTSTALATTFSPTANSIVVVWVAYHNNSSQAITSVTDNAGGGSSSYASAFSVSNVGTHYSLALFYCLAVKSGVTAITVNVPTSDRINVIVKSYTGPATAALDAASTQGTATSATQTSPNITTTGSNDLLIGYAWHTANSSTTFSATAPWGLVTNEPDTTDGAMLGAEDRLNLATGTYNAAFSTSGSVTWYCYAISFHN